MSTLDYDMMSDEKKDALKQDLEQLGKTLMVEDEKMLELMTTV